MKAKVIHTTDGVDIVMSDGGVAYIHHNGEQFLTTYYQDRIEPTDYFNDDVDIWEQLSEGKSYTTEWGDKEEVDVAMLVDAINWLGGSVDTQVEIINLTKQQSSDYYIKANLERMKAPDRSYSMGYREPVEFGFKKEDVKIGESNYPQVLENLKRNLKKHGVTV